MTHQIGPNPPRRSLLAAAFAACAGFLIFRRQTIAEADAPAASDGIDRSGGPLTTRMRQGTLSGLPLDSMVVLERGDEHNSEPNGTHEILSLIHEERGEKSFPWTLFASLDTNHVEGDATVLQSRLHKHGAGWSAGVHSEVYVHERAVALGANIEMSNDYSGSDGQEVIGLNIQAVAGPTPMQCGIQIHTGQGQFETDIKLAGKGGTGVDMPGTFGIGLNARGNSIRVDEGTCVELDGVGMIKVRYKAGKIEFLNGERCFGHLDVNGADHPL